MSSNLEDYINIEDFNEDVDQKFIETILKPYLRDLYKDLLIRSNQQEHVDKVTFIEYTKLPGIINDRFHYMFSTKVNDKSPIGVNASADRKSEKSSPYIKN